MYLRVYDTASAAPRRHFSYFTHTRTYEWRARGDDETKTILDLVLEHEEAVADGGICEKLAAQYRCGAASKGALARLFLELSLRLGSLSEARTKL